MSAAAGGCAAIGGLGDFEEVACATDCDGSTSADSASTPEASTEAGTDGGGGTDAPVDGPKDAPPFEDAAVGITCLAATCGPATEHCCVGGAGDSGCSPTAVACSALSLPCDDRDDCAAQGLTGNVCCAKLNGGGQPTSVTCSTFAACSGSHEILCNPLTSVPCPNGGTCVPAGTATLSGYHVCR